jgi:hypothetical protein
MKRKTQEKRKTYWVTQQKLSQLPPTGGCTHKAHSEIVNPGQIRKPFFNINHRILKSRARVNFPTFPVTVKARSHCFQSQFSGSYLV